MRKFIISASLVFALAACNKKEENSTTITTADGKQVKISATEGSDDSGSISMEGKDGSGTFAYGDAAAKKPLPLDLPLFPGAVVSTMTTGVGSGNTGGMFTIESKTGTAQQIAEYYKTEAEKRGMTGEISGLTGANIAGFRATGKDGNTLVLSARPGGPNGETHAMIIVENK